MVYGQLLTFPIYHYPLVHTPNFNLFKEVDFTVREAVAEDLHSY